MIYRIVSLLFLLNPCNAKLEFVISSLTVSFGGSINTFLPSCYGVDLELFVQVTTSNYTNQNTYFLLQQDANAYSVSFTNNSEFSIPSPTNFISISSLLSMRCSTAQIPISDTFLLFTQYYTSADMNNQNTAVNPVSTNYKWTLSANIFRRCNGNNEYGFNCNEQCTDVDDQHYCYKCGANGQKVCCQNVDIKQNDCSYYNSVGTTTLQPNEDCSSSAENTYFWIMISFIIVTALLIIVVLCLFLEIFCGVFTGTKSTQSDDEWDEPRPRANRSLYDADIHRTTRRRDEAMRDPADRTQNRPYTVDRQGIDNRNFADYDSSDNQQMTPRRIARV